jgi:nucleoside recognition membrane protein YjiH
MPLSIFIAAIFAVCLIAVLLIPEIKGISADFDSRRFPWPSLSVAGAVGAFVQPFPLFRSGHQRGHAPPGLRLFLSDYLFTA